MLTGDLGPTAELARDDRLGEAELALFRPLKSMLASPVADEAEVLSRLGAESGSRTSTTASAPSSTSRARTCACTAATCTTSASQFPEVVAAARDLPWDGILDGELLAFARRHGAAVHQLQARLGRKNPSAADAGRHPGHLRRLRRAGAAAPATTAAATVEPLLRLPLRERRARLDALDLPWQPTAAGSRARTC